MVDRIVFSCVAVALMGLGVSMIDWPTWVALNSRDDDDSRPVTSGEIWTMRAVGVGIILGGGYGLYAILTGMPGAEFGAP
jgi:hypothetical protein